MEWDRSSSFNLGFFFRTGPSSSSVNQEQPEALRTLRSFALSVKIRNSAGPIVWQFWILSVLLVMKNDLRSVSICRHVFIKLSQSSGLRRGRMCLKNKSSLGSNSIGKSGEESESIVASFGFVDYNLCNSRQRQRQILSSFLSLMSLKTLKTLFYSHFWSLCYCSAIFMPKFCMKRKDTMWELCSNASLLRMMTDLDIGNTRWASCPHWAPASWQR